MSSGDKRKRIRIEQQVLTPDGQGGHTVSYALRAVVAAHERPLTGQELLQGAKQLTAVLSTVWEIWFRKDLQVTDRVLFLGRTLQIQRYYDPTDERDELYLVCSEVQ